MKNQKKLTIFVLNFLIVLSSIIFAPIPISTENPKEQIFENKAFTPKLSKRDLLNATVISDGYGDNWGWNINNSDNSAIVIDDSGNLHVVWADDTPGKWGPGYDFPTNLDKEIMYAKYDEILQLTN
jgi:hypothetical protein